MSALEIYSDQIAAANWKVGHVLEDARHGSPTLGCQFEIVDYSKNSVELRQLKDDEYIVPAEIFSRIVSSKTAIVNS